MQILGRSARLAVAPYQIVAVAFPADSSNPYLRALFDRGADLVAPFGPGTVVVTDVIQA
jgi:hypothetical protein